MQMHCRAEFLSRARHAAPRRQRSLRTFFLLTIPSDAVATVPSQDIAFPLSHLAAGI